MFFRIDDTPRKSSSFLFEEVHAGEKKTKIRNVQAGFNESIADYTASNPNPCWTHNTQECLKCIAKVILAINQTNVMHGKNL